MIQSLARNFINKILNAIAVSSQDREGPEPDLMHRCFASSVTPQRRAEPSGVLTAQHLPQKSFQAGAVKFEAPSKISFL